MTHLRAIIFDLDGTLIDSAPDLHAAINVALTAQGRAALDLPTVTSFIGNGAEKLVERSLIATGGADEDLQAQVLTELLAAYGADSATLTRLYPGVRNFLEDMRAQGMQMAICTNKPQAPANQICDALGLTPYFSAIHGAREGVAKKPDPAALFNCINDLGIAPDQALYVGDSHVDQQTAQNAAVKFAFFEGGYLNAALSGTPPAVRFSDWSTDWLVQINPV